MKQVRAPAVNHIDILARTHRRSDAVERGAHVDVDDDDPERPAVRRHDRFGDQQRRQMRCFDDTVVRLQFNMRDVNSVRCQADRIPKIWLIADAPQLAFGNDAHGAVRSGAVDANNLPMAVLHPYQPQRMDRPERHLGGQPTSQPLAPERLRNLIGRIDSAVEACTHHATDRLQTLKGRNFAGAVASVGFQFGGDKPGMRLDAIEDARQQGLFQVAIAQPSDGGYRERNQQDHRGG